MPNPGIGSFFPSPDLGELDSSSQRPGHAWPPDEWVLVNSGRAALRTIAERHQQTHRRGCLWIPSYYCWDVIDYVSDAISVRTYSCSPTEHLLPPHIDVDDLLLVVSYFGAEPPENTVPQGQVVLDTTHDPNADWVDTYGAGWVFGSLRKTLPLPEGGYVHAPGRGVEHWRLSGSTEASRIESRRGADAMARKASWIAGDISIQKNDWYAALQEHETAFGKLGPSRMQPETLTAIHSIPITHWRNARLRNLRHLAEAIEGRVEASILPGTYGLPLVLPTREAADAARRQLVQQGIYPATIWPQPRGGRASDLDLAGRSLLLHTDFRYSEADMERVAWALCAGSP